MFKGMIIVAALALAGTANADTVTLSPAGGAGATHQYHNVPTSDGDQVTIYLPQLGATGGMEFYFDTQYDYVRNQFISYWIGTYNGNGVDSQAQKCVFTTDAYGNDISPCQLDGEIATINLTESSSRVCTHSGRGQNCHLVWTLLTGTITR